jgi:hypothetical protein
VVRGGRYFHERSRLLQEAAEDGLLEFVAGDRDSYTFTVRVAGEVISVPGGEVPVWLDGFRSGHAHAAWSLGQQQRE